MEILKKNLSVCCECYRFTGYVIEKYNKKVPVFCVCELKAGLHKKKKTSSIGGVIADGSVQLMWTPTSNHKESDGNWWHTSHFSGFGWGSGKKEDYARLLSWIKESEMP